MQIEGINTPLLHQKQMNTSTDKLLGPIVISYHNGLQYQMLTKAADTHTHTHTHTHTQSRRWEVLIIGDHQLLQHSTVKT